MAKTIGPSSLSTAKQKPKKCGLVMPISECDGMPPAHWVEVKNILIESLTAAGFDTELVSDADSVGIIHQRIISRLYDDDLVVCDVSGKNPNVMFELGLRIAIDRPVVIVKDEITNYTFDVGHIEHLGYQPHLRACQAKVRGFVQENPGLSSISFARGSRRVARPPRSDRLRCHSASNDERREIPERVS